LLFQYDVLNFVFQILILYLQEKTYCYFYLFSAVLKFYLLIYLSFLKFMIMLSFCQLYFTLYQNC